jgi:hypothetical protein
VTTINIIKIVKRFNGLFFSSPSHISISALAKVGAINTAKRWIITNKQPIIIIGKIAFFTFFLFSAIILGK